MTGSRTPERPHEAGRPGRQGHGSHGWMMVVCCIPMLVIALGLVAVGAVSPGFLIVAVGCTIMMALMMVGMGGMGQDR